MKNQRIIRAYDSINPSPAEKQRMLDAILAEADLSEKPVKQKRARKEPIVYKAKPTKTSRGSIIGGLAACIAAFLIGAFVLVSMSRSIEDPAYTQPDETMITGTAYDEILRKYKTALEESWTVEQCQIEDICGHIITANYSVLDVGYAVEDLDGNGREELVITNGQGLVWDLYTLLEDGTPVHVHSQEDGWPVYRLYENGVICEEDFDPGRTYEYYVYQDGVFTGPEVTFSVGESYWAYTPAGGTQQMLTTEEAEAKMAEYKLLELEQTSLLTLVSEEVAEKYKYPNAADYMDLIEKYRKAADEGWDRTMCISNNMSMLTPIESESEGLYFVMYDLNGDGVDELIISEYPYREDTDTSFIDIYTVLDGHVIQLMSLGDTSMRSLCEGGYVKDISTEQPEKYDHYVSYWRIEADQFVRDFVVYEMDGQWYTEGYRGVGAAITKAEADEIVASYPPLKLDFNPVSQNAEAASLTGYEAYDYIVNKYVTAINEGWTETQCEQNDISPSIFDDTTISYNLGWCLLDLDENGVEELVISDGVSLFDLYTILPTDGGAAHLIMEHGGMYYTLCKDGTIEERNLFSKGCSWSYYTVSDWDLNLEEMLLYRNEYVGTTATEGYYYGADEDNLQPISKDEAGNMIVNTEKSAMELTLTPFVEPEPFDPDEILHYQTLLDLYQTALDEDWNPATCQENGLSLMVAYRGEYYDDLGYAMMDLDDNGINELIITDGTNIYDLYTIIQDEEVGPLHLISAMERIKYYLTEDNLIYHFGSSSASANYQTIYSLVDRDLVLLEGYFYDGKTDPSAPWYFYDGENIGDPCGFDAQSVIDTYKTVEIPFTPFE